MGIFHHVGTFLLFASFVLLLVTSISAPVVGDIAILKVMLTNGTDIRNSSVTFGTFGYCVLDVPPDNTDQDWCSSKHIGYKPALIMEAIDKKISFSSAARSSADGLTNAMVLHPVACGLAFIAFAFALGAGIVGSLFGAIVAVLAWIVTLVVMAIDFALFGIVKDHVNRANDGIHAFYSIGMWTTLAAMVCLFFGAIIVFLSCCGARKERRRNHNSHDHKETYTTTTRRKRFGIF